MNGQTLRSLNFEKKPAPKRIIGHVKGTLPGPTLICTSALHGNEPAGFKALDRIFNTIRKNKITIRGEFLGLVGNLSALKEQRRFIDRDLNRGWFKEHIAALKAGSQLLDKTEDHERLELLENIEKVVQSATSDIIFLDLHTTSGKSVPFLVIRDILQIRKFVLDFPMPIILGLEEQLKGTLQEYMGNLVPIGFTIEGGQHDDPKSIDQLEAGIWLTLANCGIIENQGKNGYVKYSRDALTAVTEDLPRVFEVRFRHSMKPQDRFRMKPGYESFQTIKQDEILGRDATGEVKAEEKGRILMPLYQAQGEDGYFIIHEFNSIWLTVSEYLRRLQLDSVLHLLPGVKEFRGQKDTLIISKMIIRFFAIEIFHLLGYQKIRMMGKNIIMRRRLDILPK